MPQHGTLFVVFHGLFCFFQRETEILVRVPVVAHGGEHGHPQRVEHVYLAGNWLGELELQPGDHSLQCVNPGDGYFSSAYNMIIEGGQPAWYPEGLYAELHLPYPKEIRSLGRAKIDPEEYFSGNDLYRILSTKELSSVQIFTYEFDDQFKLGLTNHVWRADKVAVSLHAPAGSSVRTYCSLHIFAEPDRRKIAGMPPGMHVGHAFTAAMKMYDNIDLRLKKPLPKFDPIPASDVPDGLLALELEDLSIRMRRLQILGALKRRCAVGTACCDLDVAFSDDPFINGGEPERCTNSVS